MIYIYQTWDVVITLNIVPSYPLLLLLLYIYILLNRLVNMNSNQRNHGNPNGGQRANQAPPVQQNNPPINNAAPIAVTYVNTVDN